METETITLAQGWTYRTPLTTIEYPAGTHDVLSMIAAAAREAGALAAPDKEKEQVDGDTDGPSKARTARAANPRKG